MNATPMTEYEVEFEFSSNGMSYSEKIEAGSPDAAVGMLIAAMTGPKGAGGLGSGVMMVGVVSEDGSGYVAQAKIAL